MFWCFVLKAILLGILACFSFAFLGVGCCQTDGETPLFTVRLPLHVHAADASPYAERLLRDITALLLKLQQNGLDPLNLAARARSKALTLHAWRQLGWTTLYAKATWVVALD